MRTASVAGARELYGADTLPLPLHQVRHFDVSIGQQSNRARNSMIGLVAGAAIGGILASATYRKGKCNTSGAGEYGFRLCPG